jgi:hypothetical protein
MDTRTAKQDAGEQLAIIKQHMPATYKDIQDKQARLNGGVNQLVRRGVSGEPNCFWAMERGYVVGTPFSLPDIQQDVAWAMAGFSCAHACIYGFSQAQLDALREAGNGTH